MSKFLSLVEEFDPQNTEDPKWKLIEFLRGKGIKIAASDNSDNFQIRTEAGDITVCVMNPEEEAESINAGYGEYDVNKAVNDLADTKKKGVMGMFNRPAADAERARQERLKTSKDAIGVYKKDTESLRNSLRNYQRSSSTLPQH